MQQYYYLAAELVSFGGLLLLDWRHSLALFWDWRWSVRVIVAGFAFFLAWDIVGINMEVFWTNQQYVSGWHIYSPNMPIEEIIFLLFLCYITLLLWRMPWLRTR